MTKSLTSLLFLILSATTLYSQASANEVNTVRTAENGKENKYTLTGKEISGGVLNGKALKLPQPVYPAAARAVRAEGVVYVSVIIDEEGAIVSATTKSGHPLLRAAAVNAAKGARFTPTTLEGQPVKVAGFISYVFIGDESWGSIGKLLSKLEDGRDDSEGLRLLVGKLPSDFVAEKEEIRSFFTHSKIENGYPMADSVPVDERIARTTRLIEAIQGKLETRPADRWRFDLKILAGRVKVSIKDDAKLRSNLEKFRLLIESASHETAGEVTDGMRSIAAYSTNPVFTDEEKENILLVVN